jgi:hypothetical protein
MQGSGAGSTEKTTEPIVHRLMLPVGFGFNSMVEGHRPRALVSRWPVIWEYRFVRFVHYRRALVMSLGAVASLAFLADPAAAGIEEAVKAMQAGDVATAEKELQVLVKERDPRAQFLVGLFIYGNPETKLYDPNKATPLLLDAAERGYLPAMMPLAGAYAEGKGVPKSAFEAYKWIAIAERWNSPPPPPDQVAKLASELKPDEIEKAKAAALAYTFKTK